MTTRPRVRVDADASPREFQEAVAAMRSASLRPGVVCEEMAAPQRIAPHAAALIGDVVFDGEDLGTGRLVLLHDPAGNDAWEGTFRWVAYVRSDIDLEMANDPLLGAVGWSWLTEALAAHHAGHHALSGTVTKVSSEPFGEMEDDESTAQLEIRASWTPEGEFARHVEAWAELLCTASGLPPLPSGVTVLPSRREQRGIG